MGDLTDFVRGSLTRRKQDPLQTIFVPFFAERPFQAGRFHARRDRQARHLAKSLRNVRQCPKRSDEGVRPVV